MTASLRNQFDLSGRVAFLTGSSHILGPEFAAALAEFGARIVIVDIDGSRAERVCEDLAATFGVLSRAIVADVSDESAVESAVERTLQEFGRIDILLNGAAFKSSDYFRATEEYPLEDWNQVLGVNLTGMFLCTKHVLPHFLTQKAGVIINIASIYGVVGPDPHLYEGSRYLDQPINTPAVYAASKAGVVGFTRYLATTYASHNIRANCITPGGVSSGQNQTFVESYSARAPLGRMARREELRGAALFLASDASSYVTGHNLVVDGGFTAW